MVNYDATLKLFFDEIIKYLENLSAKAPDQVVADRITNAINSVSIIRLNPKRYSDYGIRTKIETSDMADAFIPAGTSDNRVYLIYDSVVFAMADLYSPYDWKRAAAREKLLVSIKKIKYINSKSLFKDFTYAFKSPIQFAVKNDRQK